MKMRPLAAASAFALALSMAGEVRAQSGFALDRFNPSERGSEWFAEDTLDLRGDVGGAFGVVGELALRPLVLYNPDGSVLAVPLKDSLVLHPGGSITMFKRLRLGVDVPIAALQDGSGASSAAVTVNPVSSGGLGDIRLGADVRLFGEYGDPITMALGVQAFLPTGSTTNLLGDGSFHALPRALVAGQLGWLAYAAHVGFHYRATSAALLGSSLGSELVFGAAAGVRAVDGHLLIGPEIYGSTTTGSGVFSSATTPAEALFGAHCLIGSIFRVGVGAGAGLTRGIGEPELRVLLSFELATQPPTASPAPGSEPPPPLPEPSDKDGDGILDEDDACPDVAGVKTDDPKTNGCPTDRDKDGVADSDDACADTPGVRTDDPKTNGCPNDPDRDKDGIPNEMDACPDVAGPKSRNPAKNGCPLIDIVDKQIVIREQVQFATGSAVILPASNEVLTAVAKILKTHSEIRHVHIEGHTDNVGVPAMNKKLSGKRAAAVMAWLVRHGVSRSRLSSEGLGAERPLEPNATAEGRTKNRRVEFHIQDAPRK